jgi:single-strand DNA-binding protein
MASSVNKVILVGRLGKDPEVRFTAGGKAVANFSIATDESYKDASGEKQKRTEWHNIVVWGNSVEAFVQKYLHKGDMVYIEGKLQTRSWEKDGVTKYTTEINVTDIKGLVTAPVDGGQPQQRTSTNKPQTRAAAPHTQAELDEDIPF